MQVDTKRFFQFQHRLEEMVIVLKLKARPRKAARRAGGEHGRFGDERRDDYRDDHEGYPGRSVLRQMRTASTVWWEASLTTSAKGNL
jgi:hypothetical protein